MKAITMKKLLFFSMLLSTVVLVGCSSVDNVKPTVVDGLKSALTAKKDVETSLVPNGNRNVTIGDKTITVKKETFDSVKELINANNQIEKTMVDLIGSQVTDKNIATIAYYAQKFHIDPESLLSFLKGN